MSLLAFVLGVIHGLEDFKYFRAYPNNSKKRCYSGYLSGFSDRHLVVVGWGVGSFLAKLGNRYGSPYQVYVFEFLGTCITASLFILFYRRVLKDVFLFPDWRLIGSGVLMGVSWTLATVMFIVALEKGRVSIITSLTSLYPVVTLALAVVLLRDGIRPHEILGIIFALVGGFLLSM